MDGKNSPKPPYRSKGKECRFMVEIKFFGCGSESCLSQEMMRETNRKSDIRRKLPKKIDFLAPISKIYGTGGQVFNSRPTIKETYFQLSRMEPIQGLIEAPDVSPYTGVDIDERNSVDDESGFASGHYLLRSSIPYAIFILKINPLSITATAEHLKKSQTLRQPPTGRT